jgi:hypothetical protein
MKQTSALVVLLLGLSLNQGRLKSIAIRMPNAMKSYRILGLQLLFASEVVVGVLAVQA